jgi:hypothetical protein
LQLAKRARAWRVRNNPEQRMVTTSHQTAFIREKKPMDQAIHEKEAEPAHTVEIVVHIAKDLEEQQRRDLIAALNSNAGIVAAEFCPLRYHLLLVRYDRDTYSSQDVLNRVNSHNVSARLIGPV